MDTLCIPFFTWLFLSIAIPTFAQGVPRLNSLFPAGGQLGTTIEVAIQGSDLEGAHTLIIEGEPGITAQLHPGGGAVDDTHKPVFEANCGQCHELRSPNNRSMTPAQWETTVRRMVTEKGAEINAEAQSRIIAYQSLRIGNPRALAGGGKSALVCETIAFFLKKHLTFLADCDLIYVSHWQACLALPLGNVPAYPLSRG